MIHLCAGNSTTSGLLFMVDAPGSEHSTFHDFMLFTNIVPLVLGAVFLVWFLIRPFVLGCAAACKRLCSSQPQHHANIKVSKDKLRVPNNQGSCVVDIADGPLGVGISNSVNDVGYSTQFTHFTGKSNAKQQSGGKLQAGMLLTSVNGVDMCGIEYLQVREQMKRRPCKMAFFPLESLQAEADENQMLPNFPMVGGNKQAQPFQNPLYDENEAENGPLPRTKQAITIDMDHEQANPMLFQPAQHNEDADGKFEAHL